MPATILLVALGLIMGECCIRMRWAYLPWAPPVPGLASMFEFNTLWSATWVLRFFDTWTRSFGFLGGWLFWRGVAGCTLGAGGMALLLLCQMKICMMRR